MIRDLSREEKDEIILGNLIKKGKGRCFFFPILPSNIKDVVKKNREALEKHSSCICHIGAKEREEEPIHFTIRNGWFFCCHEKRWEKAEFSQPINQFTSDMQLQPKNPVLSSIPKRCPVCGQGFAALAPMEPARLYRIDSLIRWAPVNEPFSNNMFLSYEEGTKVLYFRQTEDKCGIEGMKLQMDGVSEDETLGRVMNLKVMNAFRFIPDGTFGSFKKLKSGWKECDTLPVLGLFENRNADIPCVFHECENVFEFLKENKEFARRIGLDVMFKHYTRTQSTDEPNRYFLTYLYAYEKFPVIELLVKSGNMELVETLVKSLLSPNVKKNSDCANIIESYNGLLNQTSKASKALSIPSYISSFLKDKHAEMPEYMVWTNIYEQTKIGKERFEKFVDSTFYMEANFYDCLPDLPRILRYGYTLPQIARYFKEQRDNVPNMKVFLYLLTDYLEMSEVLGITANRLPGNIREAHDEVMAAHRAKIMKVDDEKIEKIAERYKSYENTSDTLEIVIPENVRDFVNEGIQNNNCVASYAPKVASGQCVIFFIRRKENPEKSYITCECREGGMLGQCFYRNNQMVSNREELVYAEKFCRFIGSKKWGLE